MAKKSKKDESDAPEVKSEPSPIAPVAKAPAPSMTASSAPISNGSAGLAGDVSLDGSASAPFIYFENVSVSGHMNGIVRVTLEAGRILPGENNTVYADRVIVGHLRMNIPAAQSLRNALDRALLIASKPASREMN